MNNEENPSPEELLKSVKIEEEKKTKGNLKIFLGMAAGVGKTYAMLEEAQQLNSAGIEVIVGIIDTHGRKETAMLLEGLTIIPEKTIHYKEKAFKEFDLDKIISLHPVLVLVDELAHTNVPGSRHLKRWQDVLELLENGINVYTTLNVQHIESLKDIIENIAKVPIREMVPDVLIEIATSVQLVDISPDELLKRLNEGKVYLGGQSKIAIEHFFQKDRLTALREIILRYTAEKVDHDLHEMPSIIERQKWKPREKLLVAVSHSPHSQKLIRTTKRLAFTLNATWVALHINTGKELNEIDNAMLNKNITLARELGAEVITINAPDIAEAIQRVSHQKSVTQIIIGRPQKKSSYNIFPKETLLDRLSAESSDTDILVVRQEPLPTTQQRKELLIFFPKSLSPYIAASSCVLFLTALNLFLLPIIGYRVVGCIFLLGILSLSMFVKKGPIFFSTILYALIWDYFFIPPAGSFTIASSEDNIIFALYLLTAIVTGTLIDRAKVHKEMLLSQEKSIAALYEIVSHIATASSTEEAVQLVTERLGKVMNGSFEILLKSTQNKLLLTTSSLLLSDEKERSAAIWAFENEKEAGWSTSTLPLSKNFYLPIKGFKKITGIFVYRPKTNKVLTMEEKNFIHTVGQQLTVSLEHLRKWAEIS